MEEGCHLSLACGNPFEIVEGSKNIKLGKDSWGDAKEINFQVAHLIKTL